MTGARKRPVRRAPARKKKPAAPVTVADAVREDVAGMALPAGCAGMVAAALALAREIDTPGNSATSKAMCAARLNETLDRLAERAGAQPAKDSVDELAAKRTRRIARAKVAQ